VWPHSDYPLIDVGKLTLDRNVTDYHTEIEQGRLRAEQRGARHRMESGQNAARRRLLLRRRAPRQVGKANYRQIRSMRRR